MNSLLLPARLWAVAVCMLAVLPLAAQTTEYVDDESCGCELVFIDGIQTTQSDSLFGFKRADGTIISPNIYRYVDRFQGNYCRVYLDVNQCGLIDRDGNTIVPCIYDDLDYPSDGRILAVKDGRFGFLDLSGRVAIDFSFPYAGRFSEGLAPVYVEVDSFFTACTFIDTLGRRAFPSLYEDLQPFNEGFAMVKLYQRWGMINRRGDIVLPTIYEEITSNADSIFFAGTPEGRALFDYSMKPLTDFVYTWNAFSSEGRIAVRRDDKYGFLDHSGREVIPCIYDYVGSFKQGRARVVLADRCGIIDTAGNIILPIEYEDRTPHGMKYVFFDGLALVEKDGRVGFVDTAGNLVVPLIFEQGYNFSQGVACVRHNGYWGYIDTLGDPALPFVFQYASPFEWGRAEVVYNGNISKIDLTGKCVKNCKGIIAWKIRKEP